MIQIGGSLRNINSLTLYKVPIEDPRVAAFILENGSVLLQWSQSNELKTTGVLRFLSSFKIITIKLFNISGDELTELEVDTIATIISENVQLEEVWLGSLSLKKINEDFAVLNLNRIIDDRERSPEEITNKFQPYVSTKNAGSGKQVVLSPEKMLFPNKMLIKILRALRNITGVKTLDLSSNVITEAFAEQLAAVLANSTKLETLLLENCSLGNIGARFIANSINNLKYLDLSNNDITEDQTLATVLINNPALQMLYLERNNLHSTAWDRLSGTIKNLECLRVLSIDQNIISTDMTLKLATIFSTVTDRKLYMYNHDPQTIDVIYFKGSFRISTLIMCKFPIVNELDGPSVKTVVLENGTTVIKYNSINTTAVLKFLNSFEKITTIRSYNVSNNELTELEVETIATVIHKNMQLKNVLLGLQFMATLFDDLNDLPSDSRNVLMGALHNQYCISASTGNQSTSQFKFPCRPVLLSHVSQLKFLVALEHHNVIETLDLSGNVITEELADKLAIVLNNSAKLEALLLKECSLSSNSICVIAKSLKNITTLKELRLSWDNITVEAVNCVATVIEGNIGLKLLYLDGNLHCFNKLSGAIKMLFDLEYLLVDYQMVSKDNTCELINSFISNSKIKSLVLKNYSLQVTGMVRFKMLSGNVQSLIISKLNTDHKFIAKFPFSVIVSVHDSDIIVNCFDDNVLASTGILRVVSAFKGIAHVFFRNITFTDYTDQDVREIATVVSSFTDLEELFMIGCSTALQDHIFCCLNKLHSFTLSSSRIHRNAMDKLAMVLLNNNQIKKLWLNDCLLKSSQIKRITNNVLKTHGVIESLNLLGNNITDGFDVANYIGQILLNNQCMQSFYISANRLQAKGMIKILGALKLLHKLICLTIGNNNIMDHDDSTVYDFLVEVINNNLDLEFLGVNSFCMHANAAAKVVKALTSLSCLELLDISGNNIKEGTADDIATLITNNPSLVRLYIADNYLGTVGVSKIAKSLIHPRGLVVLDIINNNITSEAARSISKIIKNNLQLKSLLLGEVVTRSIEDRHHNELT